MVLLQDQLLLLLLLIFDLWLYLISRVMVKHPSQSF